MAEKHNPKLRTLECFARITSMLVMSSASLSFAQQTVVTLGIPSAKSVPMDTSSALRMPSTTSPDSTPSITVPVAKDTVWPTIQINAYVSGGNCPDTPVQQTTDQANSSGTLIGSPGMFLSAFAQQTSSTTAIPLANASPEPIVTGNPTSTEVMPTPRPIASQPRFTDTPTGPQLSPTKWVHQPLVARQVDSYDSITALPSQAIVQGDVRPIAQHNEAAQVLNVIAPPPDPVIQVRPLTEIRRAAMRQRATRPEETFDIPNQSEPIQPGYTVEALRKTAMELIAQAELKLDIRAYLSAEEKAKKALELIAQSVDTREQSAVATSDLMLALTAIREAEDFVGKYGMVDGETITRMVRSHSTEILKPYDVSKLNGLAAADVYLDWSRRCITPLAVADPLAAEAIRILAQSHRLRDDGTPFGIATSVHLIRAAAEGSPNNHQVQIDYETTLQAAGLTGDSMVAKIGQTDPREYAGATVSHVSARLPSNPEHSIASANVAKSQANRDVKIVEVTPEQFAAISPSTSGPPGAPHAQSIASSRQNNGQSIAPSNQKSGTYRPEHVNEAAPRQTNVYQGSPYQSAASQENDSSVKGRLSRAFNPITRHFR